jgi:hypothetical protein
MYSYEDSFGVWRVFRRTGCGTFLGEDTGGRYCIQADLPPTSNGLNTNAYWEHCGTFVPTTAPPTTTAAPTTTPNPCSELNTLPLWSAGTYAKFDKVKHCIDGTYHACTADWEFEIGDALKFTTDEEPSASSSDWEIVNCETACTTAPPTTTAGPTTTPGPCAECENQGAPWSKCAQCSSIGGGAIGPYYWSNDMWYQPGDCIVYGSYLYVCLIDHLTTFSVGSVPPGIPTPYPSDTDIPFTTAPYNGQVFWSLCSPFAGQGVEITTTTAP